MTCRKHVELLPFTQDSGLTAAGDLPQKSGQDHVYGISVRLQLFPILGEKFAILAPSHSQRAGLEGVLQPRQRQPQLIPGTRYRSRRNMWPKARISLALNGILGKQVLYLSQKGCARCDHFI